MRCTYDLIGKGYEVLQCRLVVSTHAEDTTDGIDEPGEAVGLLDVFTKEGTRHVVQELLEPWMGHAISHELFNIAEYPDLIEVQHIQHQVLHLRLNGVHLAQQVIEVAVDTHHHVLKL